MSKRNQDNITSRLKERGRKIDNIAEKTASLAATAQQFARATSRPPEIQNSRPPFPSTVTISAYRSHSPATFTTASVSRTRTRTFSENDLTTLSHLDFSNIILTLISIYEKNRSILDFKSILQYTNYCNELKNSYKKSWSELDFIPVQIVSYLCSNLMALSMLSDKEETTELQQCITTLFNALPESSQEEVKTNLASLPKANSYEPIHSMHH